MTSKEPDVPIRVGTNLESAHQDEEELSIPLRHGPHADAPASLPGEEQLSGHSGGSAEGDRATNDDYAEHGHEAGRY